MEESRIRSVSPSARRTGDLRPTNHPARHPLDTGRRVGDSAHKTVYGIGISEEGPKILSFVAEKSSREEIAQVLQVAQSVIAASTEGLYSRVDPEEPTRQVLWHGLRRDLSRISTARSLSLLQMMHLMGCPCLESPIILFLQPKPEAGGRPEAYRKPHRQRHGYRPFPSDEAAEFPRRNVECIRQIGDGDRRLGRFPVDLLQHFPRMDRFFRRVRHRSLLPYTK
jgi:hypothetical protein